jgi:2'-5' RNA ligase
VRLFAALELSESALEAASAWWREAKPYLVTNRLREMPRENWHLTLAFFGEVEGRDYNPLALALEECAAVSQPMKLHFSGFGAFPSLHRPRVFWIGVRQGEKDRELRRLAGCCRRAGYANVRKQTGKSTPFQGHITLARYRSSPPPLSLESLSVLPEVPVIDWQVDRLCLIRSTLHREGARYQLLEAFGLGTRENR